MKLAVQMYTLNKDITDGESLLEVLGKVKELGFDGVEFCDLYGLDYKTVRARMDELGLKAVGHHISIDTFNENIDEVLACCEALDCKTVGVGGASTADKEEMKKTCADMKRAFDKAREHGITVYYHNHCDEFKEIDGVMPIDELVKVCKLEVDTYWSFHAGIDTPKFIRDYKDHIVHIHIKDGIDGKPCALGEGNCTVKENLEATKDIGLEWVILENDNPTPTGLEDIARSIKYLKECNL